MFSSSSLLEKEKHKPCLIIVNIILIDKVSSDRKLYWLESSPQASLKTSQLDGTDIRVLANINMTAPQSLVIDMQLNK